MGYIVIKLPTRHEAHVSNELYQNVFLYIINVTKIHFPLLFWLSWAQWRTASCWEECCFVFFAFVAHPENQTMTNTPRCDSVHHQHQQILAESINMGRGWYGQEKQKRIIFFFLKSLMIICDILQENTTSLPASHNNYGWTTLLNNSSCLFYFFHCFKHLL